MRVPLALLSVLGTLFCTAACSALQIPFALHSSNVGQSRWTLPRNSSNAAVVFDRYSLALAHGQQRLFVFAAEFHPWRLPVPSLWRDVLQKIRAAGFNAVSIYTHWGLIQPSPNPASIDLSGINDLDYFLTIANETGLFVIVRPGPYINAETTMGGMALWTANLNATLRTDDAEWQSAWQTYIKAISEVVVKHQLTYNGSRDDNLHGGSVILVQADNEYKAGRAERAYMTELVRTFKALGVSIPITYNDPSRESNFVDIVDLYGLDSYPQRFDCSHPDNWVPLRDDYLRYHLETNPDQPFYIPEFQGGSYDPYGGPGYPACLQMTDAKFVRVADQALWAQRVTLLSIYMVYGGTNWGALAEPDVYTSYDYGAALTEERQTTPKYAEYKRQGYFISSFPDLAMTEQVEDAPGLHIKHAAALNNTACEATELRTTVLENPDTHSRFYIVRHDESSSTKKTEFALEIETLGQKVVLGAKVDNITQVVIGRNYLNGRDSHIIPVDQQIGHGVVLRYTTANVFRVAIIDDVLSIDLDADPGQMYHYSLQLEDETNRIVRIQMFETDRHTFKVSDDAISKWVQISDDGRSVTTYLPTFHEGETFTRTVVYTTAKGNHIMVQAAQTSQRRRDFSTPARFSVADTHLTGQNSSSLTNRFFGQSADSVIVRDVDMLFNATYSSQKIALDTLHLWGSASVEHVTTLVALPTVNKIYWNGRQILSHTFDPARWIHFLTIPGPTREAQAWQPPSLATVTWKARDSLPEICDATQYDDKHWTQADQTHSFNPYANDPSIDTQGKVLFASEYGFHGNNILWRGSFNVSARHTPQDFSLTVEGGRFFAFSVWLNNVYLGSAEADSVQSAANRTFTIPKHAHKRGRNVVTVLQDHMGLDMEAGELPIGLHATEPVPRIRLGLEAVKLPRGIVKFGFPSLRRANISEPEVTWRVQGNYKGEQAPDKVRRSLNEGGLHAEVQGWHLPGYDASTWANVSNYSDTAKCARVMFYRTEIALDTPLEHDLGFQLRFNLPHASSTNFRAQLYINGWQMGKYVHHLGPQTVFPVQNGILNLNGHNTIGLTVWNLSDNDDCPFDPSAHLELRVSHRATGWPRDNYQLQAPSWQQLRPE